MRNAAAGRTQSGHADRGGRQRGQRRDRRPQNRYAQQVLRDCNEVVLGRYPFASSTTDVPLADFGRMFGYDGVFDTFFKANLETLVDTSESPWTWRPGAVSSSRGMLARFEAARRVRDTFFRAGSQTPALRFTVTMTDLDPGATRFVLEIDGQRFDVAHGAPRKNLGGWPGQSTGGRSRPSRIDRAPGRH